MDCPTLCSERRAAGAECRAAALIETLEDDETNRRCFLLTAAQFAATQIVRPTVLAPGPPPLIAALGRGEDERVGCRVVGVRVGAHRRLLPLGGVERVGGLGGVLGDLRGGSAADADAPLHLHGPSRGGAGLLRAGS